MIYMSCLSFYVFYLCLSNVSLSSVDARVVDNVQGQAMVDLASTSTTPAIKQIWKTRRATRAAAMMARKNFFMQVIILLPVLGFSKVSS